MRDGKTRFTVGFDASDFAKAVRFWEGLRQFGLEHHLGQVRCSNDPEAHNLENLPCQSCGATL